MCPAHGAVAGLRGYSKENVLFVHFASISLAFGAGPGNARRQNILNTCVPRT